MINWVYIEVREGWVNLNVFYYILITDNSTVGDNEDALKEIPATEWNIEGVDTDNDRHTIATFSSKEEAIAMLDTLGFVMKQPND